MSNTNMFSQTFAGSGQKLDSGLRNFMLSVYNLMCAGLVVTAIASYACLNVPAVTSVFFNVAPNGMLYGVSPLGYMAFIGPILFSMTLSFGIQSMSAASARMVFFALTATQGVGLSAILFAYTDASIAKAFLASASCFGIMSIYGHTTKHDITSWGGFLMVGLIGIMISSIINIFLGSAAVDFALSALAILVFMGLTAYDTFTLKQLYFRSGGGAYGQKIAIIGALQLYLNFINLFVYLLKFFGRRKD